MYLIFLDSSVVEHSAVNRRVVGSNPTRGAKTCKYNTYRFFCIIGNATFYIQKSDWLLPITSYYKIYTFKIAYKKLFNILPIHLTWLCPRPISNSQLHVLPHFHLCPIYLVVFKGSYNFRWDISS